MARVPTTYCLSFRCSVVFAEETRTLKNDFIQFLLLRRQEIQILPS